MVERKLKMNYWKGKKVTVTGGAGFLGSFVVKKLQERGCNSIFVPRSCEYNLVEMNAVRKLYSDAKPDIVIHLAAQVGGIGANRLNPGKFFYDNLMMGVQLMEEARHSGVEKFVAVGTVCSYPKFTPVPFSEDKIWDGYPEETNAPYGLAKKMLLVQSQAYREQYNFNSIVLIPVNLYGPRDDFDLGTSHVIPATIKKCIEAKKNGDEFIRVWGTGEASREFLYVEDCAEAILLATESYNDSHPVNIGTGSEVKITDLVKIIMELTNFGGSIKWDRSKPDGQPRRCLDVSKAKREFGFVANTSLNKGLEQTMIWYIENNRNYEENR